MKYLQAAVLTLALLLPAAASADTALLTPRAELVSVMSETKQALVKDKKQGSYVVVKVGDTVQGFRVTSIQRDQIVLSRDKQHFIIPLARKAPTKKPATKAPTSKTPATKTPATPTTKAASKNTKPVAKKPLVSTTSKLGLINPYPAKKKLTIVVAPPGLRFDPIKAARNAAKDTVRPDNKRIASVKPAVVSPARTKPTLSHKSVTIKRAEFDKAVADFTTLAKEVQIRRDGKRIVITGISRGSYFHRLGLRKGDKILSVDGKVIATMDDAAVLYAQLMAASSFKLEIERGKHRATFRYSFAN